MPVAPDPAEIFDRAVEEGQRRLDQSALELVATGFIAGFTIVFGIVGLGIAQAFVEPRFGEVGRIAGALAFGVGMVFLIVGRAELFNENFFDPVATAFDRPDSWLLRPLVRLWVGTLAFNLVGGGLFVVVLSVDGALPPGTAETLGETAAEIVHRGVAARFANAIAGGALVALLSYLLLAVDGVGGRISISYAVGFLLALGPFDHVVVTGLHVLFGMLLGADVGVGALVGTMAVATAGNLVGGIGLVTLSHVAQAWGARESGG